jgi:hypothetical protein
LDRLRQHNIILNIKLVQLADIIKIYLEFKVDFSYFVKLCKAAQSAKMSVPHVIYLLRIANDKLSSVQYRYEQLQKEKNTEPNLRTAAKDFQNLNNYITDMGKILDTLKSECEKKTAALHDLR